MLKTFVCIIKSLLPPIIFNIIKTIYLLLRYGIRYYSTIKEFDRTHDSLLIFGNGPSLNETIKSYEMSFSKYDCMVVNGFANTEYFERVKPNVYVLADPAFFIKYTIMCDRIKKLSQSLAESLKIKTQWNMTLIVPEYGRNSDLINDISDNKNINILYYNSHDLIIPLSKKHQYFLWNHNLIAPLSQTVLNTCLTLGISLNYKNIYLIGADTSWIENLRVDQENNKLYTIDKHFYGEKKIYLYADGNDTIPERLDRELLCNHRALAYYWELKSYAEYNQVNIYNASAYSLIDAFERKKLE